MKILLISDSEKKARIHTRRIASKYLFQIGADTWQGKLSKEGLESLKDELKSKRSKYMSIMIWLQKNQKDNELIYRIGNSKRFTEDGLYVYKMKKISDPYTYSENQKLKLMSYITELSALFHDLGKATDGFQEKLRLVFDAKKSSDRSLISDPVRHELVSVFIAQRFFAHCNHLKSDVFEDPDAVKDWFFNEVNAALESRYDSYIEAKNTLTNNEEINIHDTDILGDPFNFGEFESETITSSILWLILTHHKLPEVAVSESKGESGQRSRRGRRSQSSKASAMTLRASVSRYVNTKTFERLDQFFKVSDPAAKGLPWNNDSWCERVAKICKRIRQHSHQAPSIKFHEESPWATALLYAARPTLVFADHYASSRKDACQESLTEHMVFANTSKDANQKPVLADTLCTHLLKTDWDAAKYFNILFRKDRDQLKEMPRVGTEDISKDLKSNRSPEPFHWQNELYDVARELGDGPSLSVIMAETGTGKTRGCIKLGSALNPKGFRMTVGLGLRTLADQTYRDYVSHPISFNKNSVSQVIGSYYPVEDNNEKSLGTSASEDLGEQVDLIGHEDNAWESLKETGIFKKKSKLFSHPILSMTIDNIIDAVSVRSGPDTHILMHLMHSDLIIDEIDNFSPSDLSFVTMLVHIMGFYGRKVILATATMNEMIIKGMGDAYRKGVEKRQTFFESDSPRMALVQSSAPFWRVGVLDDSPESVYREMLAARKVSNNNSRHKVDVLDCVEWERSLPDIHSDLWSCAKRLLSSHFEEEDELKYSTGFIRLNNVEMAQRLSIFLSQMEDDEDVHFEIVCYHSKTTGFERNIQEYFLNNLMKRKNQALPERVDALKKGFLERAKSSGKKHAAIIVVTTNIIEVGRDHCYDWAILEPSSLSSFIQSIGRVLRHRKEKVVESSNIAVLNQPLKASWSTNKVWAYPGIETPDSGVGESPFREGFYQLKKGLSKNLSLKAEKIGMKSLGADCSESVRESRELLGQALQFPSNEWVLKMPETYEALPEHGLNLIRLYDYLVFGGAPANLSKAKSLNAGNIVSRSGYQLAMRLGQEVRFRHSQGQIDITCQTLDGSYSAPWLESTKGAHIEVDILKGIRADRFLIHHAKGSRDGMMEDFRRRLYKKAGDEYRIFSHLFQVTLFPNDTQNVYFNIHLGISNDILSPKN